MCLLSRFLSTMLSCICLSTGRKKLSPVSVLRHARMTLYRADEHLQLQLLAPGQRLALRILLCLVRGTLPYYRRVALQARRRSESIVTIPNGVLLNRCCQLHLLGCVPIGLFEEQREMIIAECATPPHQLPVACPLRACWAMARVSLLPHLAGGFPKLLGFILTTNNIGHRGWCLRSVRRYAAPHTVLVLMMPAVAAHGDTLLLLPKTGIAARSSLQDVLVIAGPPEVLLAVYQPNLRLEADTPCCRLLLAHAGLCCPC